MLVRAGFSPYDPTLGKILYGAGPAVAIYPDLSVYYFDSNNYPDCYYNVGSWARTRSTDESRLPLCNAAVRSPEWKSVRRIFDANMLAIQERDTLMGLPMFMLAAVGHRKVTSNPPITSCGRTHWQCQCIVYQVIVHSKKECFIKLIV